MDFDPNKPFKNLDQPSGGSMTFDPSKPFKNVEDEKPEVNTGVDMLKSFGAGIGRGAAGLAGLPVDILNLLNKAGEKINPMLGVKPGQTKNLPADDLKGGSEDIQKLVEQVTGEFYRPKTTAGRYAGSIGAAVPGMAIPGGGGLATRALGAIGSGAAGQAAEDFGLGSAGRFIASMIGGGAGSAAGSRFENIPKAVAPPTPRVAGGPLVGGATKPGEYVPAATRTELEAEKAAQYKFAQDNPAPVPDAHRVKLDKDIRDDFNKRGVMLRHNPGVAAEVKSLLDPRQPMTTTTVEAIRQRLLDISFLKDPTKPSQAKAARDVISHLDDYMKTEHPQLAKIYEDARGNVRAKGTSERLEKAEQKGALAGATSTGQSGDLAIRQKIRQMADSGKFPKTPEVQKALEDIATSSDKKLIQRGLRFISDFIPLISKHLIDTGKMADVWAAAKTKDRLRRLDELVRLDAPLSKEWGASTKPRQPLRLTVGLARGAATGANRLYDE